jgi:hypothetical protein
MTQNIEPASDKQKAYLAALLDSRICPEQVEGERNFLAALSVEADKPTHTRWITALQSAPYAQKLTVTPQPTPAVDTVSPQNQYGDTVTVSHVLAADLAPVVAKPYAKSTYEIFQEMELGFYTVTGGENTYHNYGDTDTAVYLVSIKKGKYSGGYKIVRRLYRDYANRPKWMAMGTSAAVKAIGGTAPVDINKVAALGLSWGFCLVCSRHLTDPFSVANGIGPVCAKRYGYKPAVQLSY